MQALISADELVAEAQPRHQPSLLEPKDGAEAPRKEDTLSNNKDRTPVRAVVAGELDLETKTRISNLFEEHTRGTRLLVATRGCKSIQQLTHDLSRSFLSKTEGQKGYAITNTAGEAAIAIGTK